MSKDQELNRKHQRDWYERNREKKIAVGASRTANRRAMLSEIKSVPCQDCGGSFPPVCMDFDHRPDEKKEFNISQSWSLAMDRIMAEVKKCDIVCSNCHRIRTDDRRKDNTLLWRNWQTRPRQKR